MKKCEHCGEDFKPRFGTEKFCSRKCYANSRLTKRYKTNCANCNKEIVLREYLYKNKDKHFCSRQCYYDSLKAHEMETRICTWCGDELETRTNSKVKYCSTDCSNKQNAIKRWERNNYDVLYYMQNGIDLDEQDIMC